MGRADTDLELKDAEVSGVHAVLRPRPDGSVEVEDLDSTNGTYVVATHDHGAIQRQLAPGSRALDDLEQEARHQPPLIAIASIFRSPSTRLMWKPIEPSLGVAPALSIV